MAKRINPEKKVEKEIQAWLFQNNFECEVYDSKGSYSEKLGRYTKHHGMKSGTPDLVGISPFGHFVAIELKAPGKESVCRMAQRQFLERKILKGGFCLVCSDVSYLANTWQTWIKLKKEDKDTEGVGYLMSLLPRKVLIEGKTISLVS